MRYFNVIIAGPQGSAYEGSFSAIQPSAIFTHVKHPLDHPACENLAPWGACRNFRKHCGSLFALRRICNCTEKFRVFSVCDMLLMHNIE
jgi:hypothetical protein